ncbi:MAG TPA: EAL domain-containing protein [Hyphomicrobiaceae bacterium]|jgi:EAL domain-containing protein (putative c-di-GMP-specific phosphodiesterase class I)|nr:EAL domain-containing protein [Hyphomicrobiaceae bacterium]
MTQQFAAPEPQLVAQEPLYVRLGDAFVILSATLMSLASGAWLIAQLGFDLSYAILAALGTYCGLLVLHVLARRRVLGRDDADDETDAGAGEDDVHWQTGAAAFDAALSRHANQADRLPAPGDAPQPRSSLGTDWPEQLPMPAPNEPEGAQAFKFRPSRMPYFEGDEEARPHAQEPAGEARETGALPSEVNVEVIQDLIKKLADELNAPPRNDSAEGAPTAVPDAAPEAMVGRSAAALETAARAMRAGEARAALEPPVAAPGDASAWWPARDASQADGPPPIDPKLARIAEAVAAERFELLIEPIHALSEGRPRHYEVSMRLLTADGAAVEQSDYTRMAQCSDLLPQIDAARMLRAAHIARRLAERGRQGSVLSAMAGDSITDNSFLDAAAQQTANEGGVRLVLSFAQSDARAFTAAHAEALGAMAAGGFGFALDDVTDLEMDFGKLKALGFEFVKLDAPVFLDGMQAPGGCVPASDICRYLSEFGLSLIVASIEDDWLLAKVMGFGVLLGKGTLFGGPRLIKADIMAKPGTAAA